MIAIQRTVQQFGTTLLDERSLMRAFESAGLPKILGITRRGDQVIMRFESTPDEQKLDALIGTHGVTELQQVQRARLEAIDARTRELIGEGFEFAGKRFSLSLAAQSSLFAADSMRDDPLVTYPTHWSTKDDDDFLEIDDAAMLHEFACAGATTMRDHRDAGTALKEKVRAALTVVDVIAVVDNR